MSKQIFCPNELEDFCLSVLKKAGVRAENAKIISDSLLFADLRGVSSHGVARLASYLSRVDKNVMQADPDMKIEKDYEGSALLNAENGFGQVAGAKAMSIAIEKAKNSGIGMVSVKNSNHFGVAAFYALQAIQRGMIGIVITNSSPAIAAYNTKNPLVGTNPLAIGIPAAEEKPLLLDMSTSVVARGKVRRAYLMGEKIPVGWVTDTEGNPTDDPALGLKGCMEPIGGPKGAGLSLMIDLLCGVLSGTSMTGEVRNITDVSGPSQTGHLFIAIDVEKFAILSDFQKKIDTIIRMIKGMPARDGGNVYLPGELEFELSAQKQAEGITIPEDVFQEFKNLSEQYEIEMPNSNR